MSPMASNGCSVFMKSRSSIEVRRCRPLLGTFVEITATGRDEACLHCAVSAAFVKMETIQRLMSAHDPRSELSLLNQEAANRAVAVSPQTFEVLRRAQGLSTESKGAFDCTVASMLARWGMLPGRLRRQDAGGWRDVVLLPGRKVRFLRPLALDLGGIAKGYAVDQAVKSLFQQGVTAGVVNAGGDVRVFGPDSATIHLRHPARPQAFGQSIRLREGALATSSPNFTRKLWRGRWVSHLVNPIRRTAVTGAISVSVRASECWLADALTKVVINAPDLAPTLLARHGAEAIVMTA